MMLITLVTAFSIPAIRTGMFSDQLKTTARRLVGLVVEVSQDAVSKQSDYLVHFDMDSDQVWSTLAQSVKVDAEEKKERGLNIPESVRVVDVTSFSGGKSSQGTSILYFSKKGYVDKTAIHLSSDDGRDMTIILSPFMGVTRIYDSYVDLEDDKVH